MTENQEIFIKFDSFLMTVKTLLLILILLTLSQLGIVRSFGSDAYLRTQVEVLDELKKTRGDVLIAIFGRDGLGGNMLERTLSKIPGLQISLNGRNLGIARGNAMFSTIPRLGVNLLTLRARNQPELSETVKFPSLKSYGVPTSIVAVEFVGSPTKPRAKLLPGSVTTRIITAIESQPGGGMARIFKLIEDNGYETINSESIVKRNFKFDGTRNYRQDESDDPGYSQDENLADDQNLESQAQQNLSNQETTDTEEKSDNLNSGDAAVESNNNERSYNISADRRSYY